KKTDHKFNVRIIKNSIILQEIVLLNQSVKYVLNSIKLVSITAISVKYMIKFVLILFYNAAIVEKIIWQMIIHVYSKQIKRKQAINMLKIFKNYNQNNNNNSSSLVQI